MKGLNDWLRVNPRVDVIQIVETHRRKDQINIEIDLPGYEYTVKEREWKQKAGGGILTIWKEELGLHPWESIFASKTDEVQNERSWSLINKGGKIALCVIYMAAESRSAGEDYKIWNKRLLEILYQEIEYLRNEGFEIVCVGDQNGHVGRTGGALMMNKKEVNFNGRLVLDLMAEQRLWIGNELQKEENIFTRTWYDKKGVLKSETLLDLALIDMSIERERVEFKIRREADRFFDSDHRLIEIKIKTTYVNTFVRETKVIPKRYTLPKDEEGWERYGREVDREVLRRGEEWVLEAARGAIPKRLNTIMVRAAEMACKKPRTAKGRKTTLTRELRDMIRQRNEWRDKIKEEGAEEEELQEYQEYRETVKNEERREIRQKNKAWRVKSLKKDMTGKMFWKMVKKKSGGRIKLTAMRNSDSDLVFKNREIGEAIRESFKKRLEGSDVPVRLNIPGAEVKGEHDEEMSKLVTLEEMDKALTGMKNGRAPDEHEVRVELIKYAGPRFKRLVLEWINEVIQEGNVPEDIKGSVVKLIYKRNDNLEPSNYRPISISPILLKLMTKIMNIRVTEILERESILSEAQYGFRPNRGTIDAIFILSSTIEKARIEKVDLHIGM